MSERSRDNILVLAALMTIEDVAMPVDLYVRMNLMGINEQDVLQTAAEIKRDEAEEYLDEARELLEEAQYSVMDAEDAETRAEGFEYLAGASYEVL